MKKLWLGLVHFILFNEFDAADLVAGRISSPLKNPNSTNPEQLEKENWLI